MKKVNKQCLLDTPHTIMTSKKKTDLRQFIVQIGRHWLVRFVVHPSSIMRIDFGQILAIGSRDSVHTSFFL